MKNIIYYAFFGDSSIDYETFTQRLLYIKNQLSWLRSCVEYHLNTYKVTVVVTCPAVFLEKVIEVINFNNFEVYDLHNSLNNYEYHGFNCLKEISKNLNKDDFIFYCHSKGVINRSFATENIFKMHTYFLLQEEIFKNLPVNIKKIGLFPSQYGWLWHNFFWINSAELNKKDLIISNSRYYYEGFVGNRSDNFGYIDCIAYRPNDFDAIGFPNKKYYLPNDLLGSLIPFYEHISKFDLANEVTVIQ
jgi:hypothetical protein